MEETSSAVTNSVVSGRKRKERDATTLLVSVVDQMSEDGSERVEEEEEMETNAAEDQQPIEQVVEEADVDGQLPMDLCLDDDHNNEDVAGTNMMDESTLIPENPSDELLRNVEKMNQKFEQIDLRDYQSQFVNVALRRNTIVHLGTGTGKTMVAMTLIHKLSPAAFQMQPPKQTVFLVPSIVLAVQQAETLQNNLPYTTCVAYGTTINAESCQQLKKANIIVATHGAYLNLLQHYGFRIRGCNLLILDECHHCVRNSIYGQIMKSYQRETVWDRPRVLGLTASPLLSVKATDSDQQIDALLDELEQTMDCSIVAIGHADASIDVDRDEYDHMIQNAREHEIFYGGQYERKFHHVMPPNIHRRRTKDFAFYVDLLNTLGPLPLKLLASSYLRSMTPYSYDKESEEEYANAQTFLKSCIEFCEQEQQETNQPLASKLRMLTSLLNQELGKDPEAIGVVFVERRLTALTMSLYFSHVLREQDEQQPSSATKMESQPTDQPPTDLIGQFMDADECVDPTKFLVSENEPVVSRESLVRSHFLVRSAHRFNSMSDTGATKDNVDEILKKFRSGIINCLICTSVAEEGMDIQTCSFAVAFDGISSSKRYIQMKGRVRHQEGKFFLLKTHPSAVPDKTVTASMKLSDLSEIDRRVTKAILRRKAPDPVTFESVDEMATETTPQDDDIPISDEFLIERQALNDGIYHASDGQVSLLSAKSLLFRFFLCQPMDRADRQYRDKMNSKLPHFITQSDQRFVLILPAHLEPRLRLVVLPDEYSGESLKKRESILSLMACVRLHKNGLLSERLLPLSQQNIQERIAEILTTCEIETPSPPPSINTAGIFYVLRINFTGGPKLEQVRKVLKSHYWRLAVVSSVLLKHLPTYTHQHTQFGMLTCALETPEVISLPVERIELLSEFFALLMNARWKKRYDQSVFVPSSGSSTVLIGVVDTKGSLDWELMKQLILDGKRDAEARFEAVKKSVVEGSSKFPSLWTKRGHHSDVYIAFRPGPKVGLDADHDALAKRIKCEEPQYLCNAIWKAPRTSAPGNATTTIDDKTEVEEELGFGCHGLKTISLSPSDCTELEYVSIPGLLLEMLLLPQILYHVERQITVQSFLEHCRSHFPILSESLESLGWREVLRLLTSTSSHNPETYERFEWLGDGVLKLLVTKLANEKNEIATWIRNFHEGNLSELRAVLTSNVWLAKCCRNACFDQFLLTEKLSRTSWKPSSLDRRNYSPASPSMKICADLIEAILGAVFYHFGFEKASQIAIEIHIVPESENTSLQHFDLDIEMQTGLYTSLDDALLFQRISKAIGHTPTTNLKLYKQAFCHSSTLDIGIKSNEILEWIGDAVLTVAARSWLFGKFETCTPGQLTLLESTVVSNRTLAFMAARLGLHHFIVHQDKLLPKRIDDFVRDLNDQASSMMWAANPPKAVADIMEALLGAVYLDEGLEKSMAAAQCCLAPILKYLTSVPESSLTILQPPKQRLKQISGEVFKFKWKTNNGNKGIEVSVAGKFLFFIQDDCFAAAEAKASAVILKAIERKQLSLDWLQKRA